MRCTKLVCMVQFLAAVILRAGDGGTGCQHKSDTVILALPVWVTAKNLKPIDDLKSSNFALFENSVPQAICDFTHLRLPLSMGIILDTSASMTGSSSNLFGVAKAAVGGMLNTAGPQDEFFLEFVSDTPEMQTDFTSDVTKIRAKLETRPKGKTALVDGIYLALNSMRKARYFNRALLIISDAEDNESVYRSKELMSAFGEAPLPIFLIIPVEKWSRRGPQGLQRNPGRDDLVQFANRSSGFALPVESAQTATDAVTRISHVIRSPYLLYFVTAKPLDSQTPRNFHVDVTGIRPRPGVSYRNAIRLSN